MRIGQEEDNQAMTPQLPEHPCIKELQKFHDAFDTEKELDRDMIANTAYLAEEVGEVVSAIRVLNRATGTPHEAQAREALGSELSDCLAYILKLANYAGIDLQDAYLEKMKHNLDREWRPNRKM